MFARRLLDICSTFARCLLDRVNTVLLSVWRIFCSYLTFCSGVVLQKRFVDGICHGGISGRFFFAVGFFAGHRFVCKGRRHESARQTMSDVFQCWFIVQPLLLRRFVFFYLRARINQKISPMPPHDICSGLAANLYVKILPAAIIHVRLIIVSYFIVDCGVRYSSVSNTA